MPGVKLWETLIAAVCTSDFGKSNLTTLFVTVGNNITPI
jgi:hypothetical protein